MGVAWVSTAAKGGQRRGVLWHAVSRGGARAGRVGGGRGRSLVVVAVSLVLRFRQALPGGVDSEARVCLDRGMDTNDRSHRSPAEGWNASAAADAAAASADRAEAAAATTPRERGSRIGRHADEAADAAEDAAEAAERGDAKAARAAAARAERHAAAAERIAAQA